MTKTTKVINGFEFTITDVGQIINMGGPWIGSLSLENNLISDNCIFDDFLVNETTMQVFFVKYHCVSNWQARNYFTINYYDIRKRENHQFDRKFEMVYLKKFLNPNELEIFHAFHDKNPNTKDLFHIDKEHSQKI